MPRHRRFVLIVAGALISAAGFTAIPTAGAAPTPSASPTPSSSATPGATPLPTAAISSASAAQKSAAAQVATLTQQIDAAQVAIAKADADSQFAEQQYALAVQKLSDARIAEAKALMAETQARAIASAAHQQLIGALVRSYQGGTSTTTSALLISPDPESAVTAIDEAQLLGKRRAQVTSASQSSEENLAAAEFTTRQSLAAQDAATSDATNALAAARNADDQAQAALATLQAELAAAQASEEQAAAALAYAQFGGTTDDSAVDQAALMAAYKAKAAQVAALPLAPSTGTWTPQIGQSVVNRALQWLGLPYSFAGGNLAGPTLGVNSGGGGEHDGSIVGFDCSGLALYSWGPYTSLIHFAATQYQTAGHLHPAVADLLPGDLVFWSGDGTASGIGHVAIYVGDGNVIQAPESGDVVKITPLAHVESGYFGATRPLT